MIFSENLSQFLKDYGFISSQVSDSEQLSSYHLDSVNIDGDPPIIVAARWNRLDIVSELLRQGASINIQDKRTALNGGATALHRAVQYVCQEPVSHTSSGQEDSDVEDNVDKTHQERVEKEAIEVVDCLINANIDLNIQDNQGATALFRAVQNNRVLMVDRLLSAGAKLDIAVHNGTTPIFAAIYGDSPLILQLLLNKGANIEQKLMGLTPAVVASILMQKGNIEYSTLAVLVNAGANLTAQDNHGNTVFDYIYHTNNQDFCLFTVNLIIEHLGRTLARCQRNYYSLDSIEKTLYSEAEKFSNKDEGRRLTRMICDKLLNQLRLERAPGCQSGIQPCPGGTRNPDGPRSLSLEMDTLISFHHESLREHSPVSIMTTDLEENDPTFEPSPSLKI